MKKVSKNKLLEASVLSRIKKYFTAAVAIFIATTVIAAPSSFDRAKIEMREKVYHDRNLAEKGTFYCGCRWEWTGRSGGRIDLASCGYKIRAQEHRAIRIEWEHVMPASAFGQQRQCWQQGGRQNCVGRDHIFRAIEADMHNLAPAIGEVNADRSNYRFGMLPTTSTQHGRCDFKVDFRDRVAEPRNEVKGQIARIYFYMHDRYDLSMSKQQQQLLMAWHKQFPPTAWEKERDRRIAVVMGHSNPFVTGERSWNLGHRNSAVGVSLSMPSIQPVVKPAEQQVGIETPVRGNQRSKIYHLPGCPSFEQVSEQNRVEFESKANAIAAGYQRAGNCR